MEREAAQYFERGRRAYADGDYAGAAVAFEAAYRLTADPALLYNQYLSCRRSGATERAADALARYIQSMPEGPERGALEQDLRGINRELGRPENTGLEGSSAATTTTTTTTTPRPPPPPPPTEHGGGIPIVSIALWGAGGAALVAGTILGITVMGTQSDLEAACPGGLCDPSRQSDIDSGRTRALVADVLFVGGAALAIGGVVLWLVLGRQHDEPTAAERATVRRDGGPRLRAAGSGLALGWSF